MNLNELKDRIPEYGKDMRVNLSNILTQDGAPGLTENQRWGIALACAYQTRQSALITMLEQEKGDRFTEDEVNGIRAATTVMAMNNVYYRFTHLMEDKEYSKMPARLRMTVIGKPGIDKITFELMCLAVSAMNGCGSCINSHAEEAKKNGLSSEGVQSAVRIASAIAGTAQALEIAALTENR